jgi:Phage integrase family
LLYRPEAQRPGRHAPADPLPLSNSALHKLIRRHCKAAGIPERLCHPHVLRAFYATTLASESVPIHVIARRLGHASIETTNRYLAEVADDTGAVGEGTRLPTPELAARAIRLTPVLAPALPVSAASILSANSCSVLPQTRNPPREQVGNK